MNPSLKRRAPWRVLSILAALAALIALMTAPAASAAPPTSIAVTISAGFNHTCVLTGANGVKCWGDNAEGQLGTGSTSSSSTPVNVSGMSNKVASVSAGGFFTCAISTSGGVKCWGRNTSGQTGTGSNASSILTPTAVSGLGSGVAAVSAGGEHACALTTAGAVKCWGRGAYGQLGNGAIVNSNVPVDVAGLTSGVIAVSAGSEHTCALTSSGAVKCWGYNAYGEVGDGTTVNAGVPVDVVGLSSGVSAITAGGYHTCALSSGALACWGHDQYGQLGDGQSGFGTFSAVPVAAAMPTIRSTWGGSYHTCAVTTAGAAMCWGANGLGSLGDGSTTDRSSAVPVAGLGSGVATVNADRGHSCAVLTNGTARCWGWNLSGQVGNGSTANPITSPVSVSGFGK